MKLSFSTNRWNNYSFDQFIDIADEYRFQGIEIHDVRAVFDAAEPGRITALYRKLMEKRLVVSCIDLVSDIAFAKDAALAELITVLDAARRLHVPAVRIKTVCCDENVSEMVAEFLTAALPMEIIWVLFLKSITALLRCSIAINTEPVRKLQPNLKSDFFALENCNIEFSE